MHFARLVAVSSVAGSNVVVVVEVVIVVVEVVGSVVVVVTVVGGARVVDILVVVAGSTSGGLTYIAEITAPATIINMSASMTFIIPLFASSRSFGLSAVYHLTA